MTKVKSKHIQALHLFKTCTGMTHAIVCLFQCTAECLDFLHSLCSSMRLMYFNLLQPDLMNRHITPILIL